MWFGRSRVQDRAGDSDERSMTDRAPMARRPDRPGSTDAPRRPTGRRATTTPQTAADAPTATRARPTSGAHRCAARGDRRRAARMSPATDARRGLADRALARSDRVDAQRRARRAFATPGARRKLQYAIAAEDAALQLHGFTSYEEFAAALRADRRANAESDETIARIRELLTELGVDPQRRSAAKPRACSSRRTKTTDTEADTTATRPRRNPWRLVEPRRRPTPIAPRVRRSPRPSCPRPSIAETVAETASTRSRRPQRSSPSRQFPSPSLEAPAESRPRPCEIIEETGADRSRARPRHAADEIELGEARPTRSGPNRRRPRSRPSRADDEAVDRWIHAEARAERMHAEVDRAQAELMAMLARSADLEESVVTRDDELDAANAELERVRLRVAELEGSIARSDAEPRRARARARGEPRPRRRARGRVARTRARVARKPRTTHALTLQAVAELETTLDARTVELEQARANVAEIEAALATHRRPSSIKPRGELDRGSHRARREHCRQRRAHRRARDDAARARGARRRTRKRSKPSSRPCGARPRARRSAGSSKRHAPSSRTRGWSSRTRATRSRSSKRNASRPTAPSCAIAASSSSCRTRSQRCARRWPRRTSRSPKRTKS